MLRALHPILPGLRSAASGEAALEMTNFPSRRSPAKAQSSGRVRGQCKADRKDRNPAITAARRIRGLDRTLSPGVWRRLIHRHCLRCGPFLAAERARPPRAGRCRCSSLRRLALQRGGCAHSEATSSRPARDALRDLSVRGPSASFPAAVPRPVSAVARRSGAACRSRGHPEHLLDVGKDPHQQSIHGRRVDIGVFGQHPVKSRTRLRIPIFPPQNFPFFDQRRGNHFKNINTGILPVSLHHPVERCQRRPGLAQPGLNDPALEKSVSRDHSNCRVRIPGESLSGATAFRMVPWPARG